MGQRLIKTNDYAKGFPFNTYCLERSFNIEKIYNNFFFYIDWTDNVWIFNINVF